MQSMDLWPYIRLMRDIDQNKYRLEYGDQIPRLKTSLLKNLLILPCAFVSPGHDSISSHLLSLAMVLPVNKILEFCPSIEIQL